MGFATLHGEIMGFQPKAVDPAKSGNGIQGQSPWPAERLRFPTYSLIFTYSKSPDWLSIPVFGGAIHDANAPGV